MKVLKRNKKISSLKNIRELKKYQKSMKLVCPEHETIFQSKQNFCKPPKLEKLFSKATEKMFWRIWLIFNEKKNHTAFQIAIVRKSNKLIQM